MAVVAAAVVAVVVAVVANPKSLLATNKAIGGNGLRGPSTGPRGQALLIVSSSPLAGSLCFHNVLHAALLTDTLSQPSQPSRVFH